MSGPSRSIVSVKCRSSILAPRPTAARQADYQSYDQTNQYSHRCKISFELLNQAALNDPVLGKGLWYAINKIQCQCLQSIINLSTTLMPSMPVLTIMGLFALATFLRKCRLLASLPTLNPTTLIDIRNSNAAMENGVER